MLSIKMLKTKLLHQKTKKIKSQNILPLTATVYSIQEILSHRPEGI